MIGHQPNFVCVLVLPSLVLLWLTDMGPAVGGGHPGRSYTYRAGTTGK